jgi:hypothetical protein
VNKKNIEMLRSINNNQWKKPRFWCFHKDMRGSTTAGYKENQRYICGEVIRLKTELRICKFSTKGSRSNACPEKGC